MKITIIGGGLFGLVCGLHFDKLGYSVEVIEQENKLLSKATKINQNRIHYGYHYPRSSETANQALDGLASFYSYFKDSIIEDFDNYYLISKQDSNLSFDEYLNFCKEVKISSRIKLPPKGLVNLNEIENSIIVREPIFDFYLLRNNLLKRVSSSDMKINYNSKPCSIEYINKKYVTKTCDGKVIESDIILNATYSGINEILSLVNSKLPLKFQDVILPIFEFNYPRVGLTVMDGKFCSMLPKGNDHNKYILSNVRHSILSEGDSCNLDSVKNFSYDDLAQFENNIYEESSRFFPFLKDVRRTKIWRTTKALSTDKNDGRVSEVFVHPNLPNFYSVLQGKVTTCLQIAYELEARIEKKKIDIIV
jgi:hypothetical protein